MVLYISTMGGEVVFHKVSLKYVLHLLFILILKAGNNETQAGKVRPEQLSPSCANFPIVFSLSCSLCLHWSAKRKASSLIAVISCNPSLSPHIASRSDQSLTNQNHESPVINECLGRASSNYINFRPK